MVPSLQWEMDYADVARFCSAAGKHAVALDACAIGMRLHGRTPELLVRRALANDGLGRYDLAIAECVEALEADPAPDVAALAGAALTLALASAGSAQAALDAARLAISAAPDAIEPHCAYGNVLAWSGDWRAAWPELECHWLTERAAARTRFGYDEWNGEDLAGKRVTVVHAQGLGDLVQMARYLPRLRARCAHLTLESPAALAPLLRDVPGIDAIAAPGAMTPFDTDAYARAMTLPRLFDETGTTRIAPYLRVPALYRERWNGRGERDARPRVGLAWAGNPYHPRDRSRSITIDAFAPLAALPDLAWTSLQFGPNANDAERAPFALARYDDAIRDLADTAALISQLDLVITVDTAVAHLAGALGKPVWLMLAQRPDWRWSRASATTPWYRSMRLFHASEPGWSGVIADVSRSLEAWSERAQPLSADTVDKHVERPKVSDTNSRRAIVSPARGGQRTP